ncbi:MAG: hypothetical protein EOO44_20980 [Flavobacterium sp.]|nr:MAG: hypothetical protein EOO44_20980 [Flavobacterium sp.]
MKKNILIDILIFGEQNLLLKKDFSRNEIKIHLAKSYESSFVENIIDTFLNDNFIDLSHDHYRLTSDGYSILLNQRNFNSARKGIWIAIALGMISIFFSLYTIFFSSNDIKIENGQYREIINILQRTKDTDTVIKTIKITNPKLKNP